MMVVQWRSPCRYGSRWRHGKFNPSNGCHTVYEPREVIDPASDDR
jgi:hypothetical protein